MPAPRGDERHSERHRDSSRSRRSSNVVLLPKKAPEPESRPARATNALAVKPALLSRPRLSSKNEVLLRRRREIEDRPAAQPEATSPRRRRAAQATASPIREHRLHTTPKRRSHESGSASGRSGSPRSDRSGARIDDVETRSRPRAVSRGSPGALLGYGESKKGKKPLGAGDAARGGVPEAKR
mmetsp:Transcript_42835/g.112944  ORF Transcript_42835/g.112944 Transcript_42835/m.112944 type:complete len:183 (-) Transcript_42835:82-630(-)